MEAHKTLLAVLGERLGSGFAGSRVERFIAQWPIFHLNFWMAGSKCVLAAAAGVEGSAIVTAFAGNGARFGLQVGGLPGRWFTVRATPPRGKLREPHTVETCGGAYGDSALAEAQLNTYRLRAPFDGIVTRRFKQKGEAIRQGEAVIELVDVSTMKVEGRIPLGQALRLRPGQKVVVQLVDSEDRAGVLPSEFKRARFPGRLVFIDPGVSLVGERDVRVWAEVANLGGLLRHGLTAHITIDSAVAP